MNRRSHITLTEAATEISEGERQTAAVYIDALHVRESKRRERICDSARGRVEALKSAGFDPELFMAADPNPLLGRLPEIASHNALSASQSADREEEASRFRRANNEIVAAGARGDLTIKARFEGRGPLVDVETAELKYLKFFEETGFDRLYNCENQQEWTQVTLDEEKFLRWRESRLKSVLDPTIAMETRAVAMLARELRTDSDLTKADAKGFLSRSGIKFTGRGFDIRIWPDARSQAGLARNAPPGVKPNRRS